jgi:hypothetical protein
MDCFFAAEYFYLHTQLRRTTFLVGIVDEGRSRSASAT